MAIGHAQMLATRRRKQKTKKRIAGAARQGKKLGNKDPGRKRSP